MHDRLIQALVASKNEAADDVLLEGMRVGNALEKGILIDALLARKTTHGLGGLIELYDELPEPLQRRMIENVKVLHHALRECGRSDRVELRLAAMKFIALSRQGKLAYVLSENLHSNNEALAKAGVDAMVALARWVATETRWLQKGSGFRVQGSGNAGGGVPEASSSPSSPESGTLPPEPAPDAVYRELMDQRPEIEAAVARAMEMHRAKNGPELVRAALLLCDWPGSKTLAILTSGKHGGQSPMVRRLQQPPTSEHADAFLLGASHGQLRTHFGAAFSNIDEAPVLDAILRRTHWLKDHQLQLCMHQVARGTWWNEAELQRDATRRDPEDAAKIGQWLAVSGTHDVVQDERMLKLLEHAKNHFGARLRLLRIAVGRKKGASVRLLRQFLSDPDERLVRMAAREIVRRKPQDFENMLLQLMTAAPDSVRRVISRSIGQVGFEHFWTRFDRLDAATRKQAGRAMMKLLPDAVQRLQRRLASGPIEQRLKAMQVAEELGVAEALHATLVSLSNHPHPKVRSKAVGVLGELSAATPDALLDRVLNDADPRVRANAIEVLENAERTDYIALLTERARSNHNRERANAIKALHRMKVGAAGPQLLHMLQDGRAEHRISAMWALKQIGWWRLLHEVGRLAKEDTNMRVRRYALAVLKGVADLAQKERAAAQRQVDGAAEKIDWNKRESA